VDGGICELYDLFRGEPWFGEGGKFALRLRTAGGAGSCATRSGAGATTGAVGGSKGGEGETQSSGLPLVGADGGVAAMSLVLTSVSELLWGR